MATNTASRGTEPTITQPAAWTISISRPARAGRCGFQRSATIAPTAAQMPEHAWNQPSAPEPQPLPCTRWTRPTASTGPTHRLSPKKAITSVRATSSRRR